VKRRRLQPPGGSSMKLLDRILLGICAVVLALFAGLLLATMWGSTFVVNWLLSSNVLLEGGIAVAFLHAEAGHFLGALQSIESGVGLFT
jgi:hypothetical protein